jgi:cobalamin biosynthesis Mg chelatase CobN
MKQVASFAAVLAVVLVVGFTHTVAAQETTVVEIKKGEVLRVLNNTVVVRVEGEGVRTYVVPYDFKFNHEGQEITVRELRAGHQLTSVRLRTVGAPQDIAEEDVEKLTAEDTGAPADVVEAVTQAAEAVTEAVAQSEGDDESSEDGEESAEAPAAAAAAAESAETAEAAAAESGGMSPALMIGLLLLALVLVVFAVKQLRKA